MADSVNDKPRLRPVDAFPVEKEGRQWIALVDPSGLAEAQIALTPPAFFIISHFDGQRSLQEIQGAFLRRFGQVVPVDQVRALVSQLDEALMLESPRLAEVLRSQVDAYIASDVRAFRRESMPPDDMLEPLVSRICRPNDAAILTAGKRSLVGLVAPHLDYPRGEPCYAAAYGVLAGLARAGWRPQRVVVLGTNHYGMKPGPVATDKDFETLYGRVGTDREALERLSAACGQDLCQGQFDHVREHSVELQATLLARLLGSESFRMIGLILPDVCEPSSQTQLNRLADGLAGLADRDGRTLIVVGADLSHIGTRFGDERELDDGWLTYVAESDRQIVRHLETGEPEAFVEALRDSSNITRICSSGGLYALRKALPGATWENLGYHQACDMETGTCVTCMAAALWEQR